MCLGIPARIIAIKDAALGSAVAETDGVRREINLAMLVIQDTPLESLIGRWVLLHVGFAMAVIDEQQAMASLALLKEADDE
jgi:hydrogenase expression/formation protein HypC